MVGAGGLGSPLALYLAAAGVGTIGMVDDDRLELSNLQRQIAHTTARIGRPRRNPPQKLGGRINPGCASSRTRCAWTPTTPLDLIARYDLVCDGTDNFATRFLVADACALARRTLVVRRGAALRGTALGIQAAQGGRPCYRCLYPEAPPEGVVPTCSEAGVLGAVTGVMGTLQATEVLKEILGIGDSLSGKLLVWDALASRFRTVKLRRRPALRAVRAAGDDQGPVRARRRAAGASALWPSDRPSASCCCPARTTARITPSCSPPAPRHSAARWCCSPPMPAATRSSPTGPAWTDPPRDARVRAAGVAGLEELREACSELGVRLIACEAGLRAEGLDPPIG